MVTSLTLYNLQNKKMKAWNEADHWEEYLYMPYCVLLLHMYALQDFWVVIVEKQVE